MLLCACDLYDVRNVCMVCGVLLFAWIEKFSARGTFALRCSCWARVTSAITSLCSLSCVQQLDTFIGKMSV